MIPAKPRYRGVAGVSVDARRLALTGVKGAWVMARPAKALYVGPRRFRRRTSRRAAAGNGGTDQLLLSAGRPRRLEQELSEQSPGHDRGSPLIMTGQITQTDGPLPGSAGVPPACGP